METFSKTGCRLSRLLLSVVLSFVFFNSGVFAEDVKNYTGYKVLSVNPQSKDDLKVLFDLQNNPEIDFWKLTSVTGSKNIFSVSPKELESVLSTLRNANLTSTVLINDLQKSVQGEFEEHIRSIPWLGGEISHNRYHEYDEIVRFARDLEKNHGDLVKVEEIGKTHENRSVIAVVVSTSNGKRNRGVFVDAGIHAREWIAPAFAVFLLDQLVNNNTITQELLTDLDWYIVPVLNPDGYDYTFKGAGTRFWRKNRNPSPKVPKCTGVDVNRNFGYHWNEIGASQDPCSETYSGAKNFSELEAIALRDYILSLKPKLKTYLTFHSYGNYILHPWGFTSSLPADADELKYIGEEANKAMIKAGSNPYEVGSSTVVLYPAAGGSDDWAKGVGEIEKSYTIELPGGGEFGFDMPPYEIEKTVRQVIEGVRVFAKFAKVQQ